MRRKTDKFGWAVVGVLLSLLTLYPLGVWAGCNEVQREAVETECARYNHDTGEFEWVEP